MKCSLIDQMTLKHDIIYRRNCTLKTAKEGKVTAQPHQFRCLCEKGKKRSAKVKQSYEQKLIRSTLKDITKAQRILDKAYANVDAEYIQGKIDKIVGLHTEKQHAAAWKT